VNIRSVCNYTRIFPKKKEIGGFLNSRGAEGGQKQNKNVIKNRKKRANFLEKRKI
jgi:hypothetical protein